MFSPTATSLDGLVRAFAHRLSAIDTVVLRSHLHNSLLGGCNLEFLIPRKVKAGGRHKLHGGPVDSMWRLWTRVGLAV